MSRWKTLMLLIILLISTTAFSANAGEESLTINLESGDPGESLKVEWPEWIDEKIQLVNDGFGEFVIEISNDPMGWQLVNWLENQPKTGIDSNRLEMSFDGGVNVARMQNATRLLKDRGLERLALRYIPIRSTEVFIKIYFEEYSWIEPVAQNKLEISRLQHDYDVMSGELESLKNAQPKVEFYSTDSWDLRIGVESTVVSDGKPVIAPVLELNWSSEDWMFGATGGYLPAGDTDQRFLAGSLSYLPNDNKFGPVLRVIYASENLTVNGGYLQEGFGPTVGMIFHGEKLTALLTGGIQYFDRQYQDRRIEPTINLSVKLHALSF